MENKKNILIISYDFSLEAGGIQNTSYLLAVELTKYANVFTLCPADGNAPVHSEIKTYKSKYSNIAIEINKYEKETCEIAEKIHAEYGLNYVLCLLYNFSEPAYYLKKKYEIPYGVMTYGNDVMSFDIKEIIRHPRSRIKSICYRKKILYNASHIFCCSNFTEKLVDLIIPHKQKYVIHPPIGISESNIIINTDAKHIILSIGRLVERKGYQNVIKALPKVIKEIPSVKYIVAGSGEYEKELINQVKLFGVEDNVIFKGRVSEEEKCQLLSNCDIFIMPSFMMKEAREVEGFGLSMLEANLYGKFVISSYSGGIPEAIIENKTGFLVREHDVDGIADAIIRFYTKKFEYDPQNCVSWAKSHDISVIANQYWNFINQEMK